MYWRYTDTAKGIVGKWISIKLFEKENTIIKKIRAKMNIHRMFETNMNPSKQNIICRHPHVCNIGNLILSNYQITLYPNINHHLNRQWSLMTPNDTMISQCLRVISKL